MATTTFPVNPELTAVAIGYKNPDVTLIADKVMPRIPKSGKKFSYTRYTQADAYTVPPTRVGRKSEPTMVDFGGVLVQDECVDWGLDDLVPSDEIQAWEASMRPAVGGPVSPLVKSTSLLTSLVQLDREQRVAGIAFNSASYLAGNQATLAGTSQWSDFANSNPLDAILAALDVPVMRPNLLVLGQSTWTKLRQHPRIVQAIFGTAQTGGAVGRQALADLLELREVLVGASFVNTARRGQAPVMSRVWGEHQALLYVSEQMADADQPTWGFTAQFGDRVAGDIPAPQVGLRGGVRVRSGESVKEVLAANDVGYYFQNAVA